jgi:GrpB-like predicted nucleotidyltransferase (UPF0157 family)
MAKYKVEQVSEHGGKARRTAVVNESRVSEVRDSFRRTMRKSPDESSDWVTVKEQKGGRG